MGYQITVEIPDGDWCLKLSDPYILCPLLVTDSENFYCPFDHKETSTPLNSIFGSTVSKGGIVKCPSCPSRNRVNDDQIDFWTYQKLQQIRHK